jgi:uncharacterized membrane protein YbhN (UPF0104 family)
MDKVDQIGQYGKVISVEEEVTKRPVYRQMARWIGVIAIFLFLGKMVWENWNQVKDTPFSLQPFALVLSTLLFISSYFIQIWAWYLISLKLDIAVSPSETLKIWFYSQLGKYLPGKIWVFLSRFHFYRSRGQSEKAISVAIYLETVTMVVPAGLIFLAALIFYRDMRPLYFWLQSEWLILPFLLGFASLHPWILQKVLNWILIQFKREPVSLSFSYSDILCVLLVCVLSWLSGGVGFYFFVDSVFPVGPQYILFLTGALAFSNTLGLVALFAPSGLGVREGALVYLLSSMMVTPVAVIISVLTRIWMTLIEIGLIGVVYLLDKIGKGSEKGGSDVKT